MTTSTSFSTFLNNIKVDKSNNINSRYKEITKKLNRTFRDTDSETANSLGEFYQFNLSSCIRQQNSLTAQFVSFSLANLANIFYPPNFYNN